MSDIPGSMDPGCEYIKDLWVHMPGLKGPEYVSICQDLWTLNVNIMGPEYVIVCQDSWIMNMSICARIYGS